MLDLNDIRTQFAEYLAADPTRWRMDAALAHVVETAYRQGLADAAQPCIHGAADIPPYAQCRDCEHHSLRAILRTDAA